MFTFRAALRSLWNFHLSEYKEVVKECGLNRTVGGSSRETATAFPHTTQICDISSDHPPKCSKLFCLRGQAERNGCFAPEAANREWHLGEITANFVATIRRSLFGAGP